MKKLSIVFAALVAVMTLNAKVVTFDFTKPTTLGLTPSATASTGVALNTETITVDGVTMSFDCTGSTNGAKLWTATGPAYTLRLYTPSKMILTSDGENIRCVRVAKSQGDIKELDENKELRCDAQTVTLSVPDKGKANYISKVEVYVGEVPGVLTIDTIGVAEARQRIKDDKLDACVVKGVVATAPAAVQSYGNTYFWMTDIANAADSLEAYKIYKGANQAKYANDSEIQFGLGDTIMIYADNLALFGTSVYETTSGYYLATIGKTTITDISANYPYGLGALYQGEENGKHKWNVALQVSETDNKGVVFAISNSDNHGIAGNYTLAATSTYNADGTPVAISGSVKIKYASISASGYNVYNIVSNFMADGKNYRIEGTYELPGWKADLSDNVSLENDVPFTPTPGAEITCAQAKEYTLSLESGATSDMEVTVVGYATSMLDAQSSSTQQSFWMDDEKGTKKTFEAFYCDIPVGKKVVVGTKVAVTGKVSNYNGTTAEMKNGKIRILEGGEDVKREAVVEPIPDGAISVAQAMEIGNALTAEVGSTAETEQDYIVLGYVAKVSYAMKNDTATWFMTDEQGAVFGELQAYKCQIAADIYAGDQVFVIGKISKYQKDASTANIEIAKGEGHFAALTTDLEKVIATLAPSTNKAVKVIVDGQLFIIRDGKTYTSQGALVK